MNWARLLRHRFVYVPPGLAGIVVAWNVYMATNNDGVIEGEVRDAGGARSRMPRDLFRAQLRQLPGEVRTRTDARGAYRFNDMQVHIGQLEARLEDGRRSERGPAAALVQGAAHACRAARRACAAPVSEARGCPSGTVSSFHTDSSDWRVANVREICRQGDLDDGRDRAGPDSLTSAPAGGT